MIGRRSCYIVPSIVYERQTKDKRLLYKAYSQMNTTHLTKIDQEKRKTEEICIWNPMTTWFIM